MWILKDIKEIPYSSGNIPNKNIETATSVLYKNNKLYIGRADGKIECIDNSLQKLYEFESHKQEFDYLESAEISEKIICLESFKDGGLSEYVICSNEKSIKLWKTRPNFPNFQIINEFTDFAPKEYKHTLVKELKNVHQYNINSIAISKGNENVITSDYLKINLWNPYKMENCYNIVDIKPQKFEELLFVITSSTFNPENPSIFGYSTSKGEIFLNDLRTCSKSERIRSVGNKQKKSIYDDLIKSISHFKFVNENLICARDLNSITFYDLRNSDKKLLEFILFKPHGKLIEEIFDNQISHEKFCLDVNGCKVASGCYGSKIRIFDHISGNIDEITLEKDCKEDDFSKKVKNIAFYDDMIAATMEKSCFFLRDE